MPGQVGRRGFPSFHPAVKVGSSPSPGTIFFEGGEIVGRPRTIKSVKRMEELWKEYKADCDNQMVLTHDFSAKNSEFVSKELRRSTTYTIEGFCVFIGLTRSAFYDTYAADEKFSDIVTRMKEECEVDARRKFETGQIPTQLSGLWMSKHGYSTKSDISESVSDNQAKKHNSLIAAIKERTEHD